MNGAVAVVRDPTGELKYTFISGDRYIVDGTYLDIIQQTVTAARYEEVPVSEQLIGDPYDPVLLKIPGRS